MRYISAAPDAEVKETPHRLAMSPEAFHRPKFSLKSLRNLVEIPDTNLYYEHGTMILVIISPFSGSGARDRRPCTSARARGASNLQSIYRCPLNHVGSLEASAIEVHPSLPTQVRRVPRTIRDRDSSIAAHLIARTLEWTKPGSLLR